MTKMTNYLSKLKEQEFYFLSFKKFRLKINYTVKNEIEGLLKRFSMRKGP